jgi:acetyl esterase
MTSLRSAVTAAALTMTASGVLAAPVLESTTQKFIDSLAGAKPIYTLGPQAAREVLLGAQSGPVELPAVSIADRVLPVGPTGHTRIRVIPWVPRDTHVSV